MVGGQLQGQPERARAESFPKREGGGSRPWGRPGWFPQVGYKPDLLGKGESVCCLKMGMLWVLVESASISRTSSDNHLPCIQFIQRIFN